MGGSMGQKIRNSKSEILKRKGGGQIHLAEGLRLVKAAVSFRDA
jgi:hypothetical protein